ncbi:hypothetical protein [Mucilaginibacter arboris]|nr:hypothetical protein [Mucilaginibacter arboris]
MMISEPRSTTVQSSCMVKRVWVEVMLEMVDFRWIKTVSVVA